MQWVPRKFTPLSIVRATAANTTLPSTVVTGVLSPSQDECDIAHQSCERDCVVHNLLINYDSRDGHPNYGIYSLSPG